MSSSWCCLFIFDKINLILRAHIKIQNNPKSYQQIIEKKKYSVTSSSKIVVTLNKVAFFSHWMLLEGVLRMVAWKSWFPSRIGRIKLKGKTRENLMIQKKNLPSKKGAVPRWSFPCSQKPKFNCEYISQSKMIKELGQMCHVSQFSFLILVMPIFDPKPWLTWSKK